MFAFGISIPDSNIVVHTKIFISLLTKSIIISSSSFPDIFPCAKPTFASGTSSNIWFAFLSIVSVLLYK